MTVKDDPNFAIKQMRLEQIGAAYVNESVTAAINKREHPKEQKRASRKRV